MAKQQWNFKSFSNHIDPGSPFSRSAGLGDILRDIEIQREKASKTNHMLVEIHDLEAQLAALKIEVSSLRTHNRRLEEQVEWKSHEAAQTQEKISRLQNQITEMDAANKDQEQLFSSSRKQFEDDKQLHTSKITELEAKAEGMQSELDSLKQQKSELEVRLFDETKQWSSKVEGLLEQIRSLLQVEALRNEQSLSEQEKEIIDRIKGLEVRRTCCRTTEQDFQNLVHFQLCKPVGNKKEPRHSRLER